MKLAENQRLMIRGIQVIILLAAVFAPAARGQEHLVQDSAAPPPLKIISRTERTQLNDSKDAKARVRTTLELAETHLANAEMQTSQHDYDGAAAEAGKYWALVEDVFSFLKTINSDSNKTRDLYKRIELTLRAQGPRLSTMRRSTPSEYAVWIKEIEDFARSGRTEALNSFYGHTVLRDRQPKSSDQKEAVKPIQKTSIIPD
jgi:hypothetical protein